MRKMLWVALCLLVACPLACAWPRAHREHGAALFAGNGCQHCHRIGNVGGHKGPDLSAVGKQMNRKQLRVQILEGGNGMPPFRDVVAATDINDLVAFLHSCRTVASK